MPKNNTSSKEIKYNLINQIDNSVRWLETIENLEYDGHKNFIEVGPKNILTNLNKNIIPELNFCNFESTKFYD